MRKYTRLALLSTAIVLAITLLMPALVPASLVVQAATLPEIKATLTPDIPVDVELYVLEVTQHATTMGQAINDMSELLLAPDIGNTDWMIDLAVAFVTIQQAHKGIVALEVPPAMVGVHREVLSMSMACNNATLAISSGIDNFDVDELNRGSDLLSLCAANAQSATAAMSAALANYNAPAGITATPTPKATATPKITPTPRAAATATPKAAAASPFANKNANLRSGPGTTFGIVGSVKTGQALDLVGRNADSTWYKLKAGQWIAAFLVTGAPTNLPVVK